MKCFRTQIVPSQGECAICFETDKKLQSFDCANCLEGAWFICKECKEKIEKSKDSWGNKCPVCREPKELKIKNTVIVPTEIIQSTPEITIPAGEFRNKIRCCCLKLPSDNDYYLRENPGNYIFIDCGYITHMICTFIGVIALGFFMGFYACQKNEQVLCPFCIMTGVISIAFLVILLVILFSNNQSYFKRDPIRKDKIKLLVSVIGTIIYSAAIANSEGCSINWYGYLSSIILFPIIYNCTHCALNCFV